jgi:hypothetical protein
MGPKTAAPDSPWMLKTKISSFLEAVILLVKLPQRAGAALRGLGERGLHPDLRSW